MEPNREPGTSCHKMESVGGFPSVRNRALKEQAVAYYQENQVPEVLEKLLNTMYLAKPEDVYGYMSEYFYSMATDPFITSVVAHEGMDDHGGRSLVVELHCTVCGVVKMMGRSSLSVEDSPPPLIPVVNETKVSRQNAKASIAAATKKKSQEIKKLEGLESIKKYLCECVVGFPVKQLAQIDQAMDDIRCSTSISKLILHPNSLLAVSCAAAVAGANLSPCPLFLHLISTITQTYTEAPPSAVRNSPGSSKVDIVLDRKSEENSSSLKVPRMLPSRSKLSGGISSPSISPPGSPARRKFSLPIPMVSILGRGTGKLRMREFCLTPLPGTPLPQQMKALGKIYAEIGKIVCAKPGFSSQASGPYCVSIDKVEHALDWIQEAITVAGLQSDVDVAIFIDVGADNFYDEEKNKYELVTGQWKNSDEMANIYSDLLQSTNGLLGFIDPLHPKDLQGWKKLHNKLGSKCLFIADSALEKGLPLAELKRPEKKIGLLERNDVHHHQQEEPRAQSKDDSLEDISCVSLTWHNTLSSTISKIDDLKYFSHNIMLRVPSVLTANTVIVDLAVASGCRFIRVGAPVGNSTLLLNRMLEIREELVHRRIHEPAKAHLLGSRFEQ